MINFDGDYLPDDMDFDDMNYDPIYEAITAGQNVVFQIHVNNLDGFMTVMGAGVLPGTGFVAEVPNCSISFTNGSYHTTA